jgi:cell division protein FtsB
MGRYFILAALVAAIGFVGCQIYGVAADYRGLESERQAAKDESESLTRENAELNERIDYLGKPENLIKEIKSRFNYRLPEEKTIIIAPER